MMDSNGNGRMGSNQCKMGGNSHGTKKGTPTAMAAKGKGGKKAASANPDGKKSRP